MQELGSSSVRGWTLAVAIEGHRGSVALPSWQLWEDSRPAEDGVHLFAAPIAASQTVGRACLFLLDGRSIHFISAIRVLWMRALLGDPKDPRIGPLQVEPPRVKLEIQFASEDEAHGVKPRHGASSNRLAGIHSSIPGIYFGVPACWTKALGIARGNPKGRRP